jgi:hypothetical protein
MLKKITLAGTAVVFGALLAVNLPDIRRYLRMRAM